MDLGAILRQLAILGIMHEELALDVAPSSDATETGQLGTATLHRNRSVPRMVGHRNPHGRDVDCCGRGSLHRLCGKLRLSLEADRSQQIQAISQAAEI